ncbi:hypothetical protein CCP3SC15_730015 [Gammaproteobacteria bacterium]
MEGALEGDCSQPTEDSSNAFHQTAEWSPIHLLKPSRKLEECTGSEVSPIRQIIPGNLPKDLSAAGGCRETDISAPI